MVVVAVFVFVVAVVVVVVVGIQYFNSSHSNDRWGIGGRGGEVSQAEGGIIGVSVLHNFFLSTVDG